MNFHIRIIIFTNFSITVKEIDVTSKKESDNQIAKKWQWKQV